MEDENEQQEDDQAVQGDEEPAIQLEKEQNEGTSEEETSDEESPPRRMRSLNEIYSACGLALVAEEPTQFTEAVKQTEWKLAMEEEIKSIEKNKT